MGWGRAVARAGCPRCRAWDAWPGRDWTGECNYSADVWERSPSGFYPGRRWNTARVKAKKDQGTTQHTWDTWPDAAKQTSRPLHMDPTAAGETTEGLFSDGGCFNCHSTKQHRILMNVISTSAVAQETASINLVKDFKMGQIEQSFIHIIIVSEATRGAVIIRPAKQSSMIGLCLHQGKMIPNE